MLEEAEELVELVLAVGFGVKERGVLLAECPGLGAAPDELFERLVPVVLEDDLVEREVEVPEDLPGALEEVVGDEVHHHEEDILLLEDAGIKVHPSAAEDVERREGDDRAADEEQLLGLQRL